MSELQDVLRALEDGRVRGSRMALATIIAVEGSTYRREGARLVVDENGSQTGNISGGCLEGEVRAAAAGVVEDGRPRILHFDLSADDEVVWGWGLGCNGVVDVFVEPADRAAEIARTMRRAEEEQRDLAVLTVVEAPEEGPPETGARLVVHPDGATEGTLADAVLDARAVAAGLAALRDERSSTIDLGGGVRAFVEVMRPPLRLLVCGAGHDAAPLVRHAAELGWRVEVIDDREQFLRPTRFPEASRFVRCDPAHAAAEAGVDARTFVVVMSHNFLRDKDYLRSFLGSPARYIGMLGPAARLRRLLEALRRDGFEPEPDDLRVVHGPAGLDLGGDGPQEVALAIVAEIMAVRGGRRGGFLRERTGPIHGRRPTAAASARG